MTTTPTIYEVQVRRGAAHKYAWSTTRLIAVVGPSDTIIAATGRLIAWRSGNFSSQAAHTAANFRATWTDRTIPIAEAIQLARARARRPRGIRSLERLATIGSDYQIEV